MKIEDHPLGRSLAAMNIHPDAQGWSPSVRDFAAASGMTYEDASAAAYALYEKTYAKHWAFGVGDLWEPIEANLDMQDAYHHRISVH